ncbi:hypothetical protein BaRGS_00006007 [Batillaria attramentaria]|uniref:BZIP domain-containing protein n=1 Tax=Batillaria attramentaria TaxID=370345 RepID=A0ABD0LTF5_9CAEN
MSQKFDEDLVAASKEAMNTGCLTPLLKKELWLKIQSRRLAEGKEELSVPSTPSLSYQQSRQVHAHNPFFSRVHACASGLAHIPKWDKSAKCDWLLQISQAERHKKQRRREQNRRAAKRFRTKEKSRRLELLARIDELKTSNDELEKSRVSLIQEKNQFLLQLCQHLKDCRDCPVPSLESNVTSPLFPGPSRSNESGSRSVENPSLLMTGGEGLQVYIAAGAPDCLGLADDASAAADRGSDIMSNTVQSGLRQASDHADADVHIPEAQDAGGCYEAVPADVAGYTQLEHFRSAAASTFTVCLDPHRNPAPGEKTENDAKKLSRPEHGVDATVQTVPDYCHTTSHVSQQLPVNVSLDDNWSRVHDVAILTRPDEPGHDRGNQESDMSQQNHLVFRITDGKLCQLEARHLPPTNTGNALILNMPSTATKSNRFEIVDSWAAFTAEKSQILGPGLPSSSNSDNVQTLSPNSTHAERPNLKRNRSSHTGKPRRKRSRCQSYGQSTPSLETKDKLLSESSTSIQNCFLGHTANQASVVSCTETHSGLPLGSANKTGTAGYTQHGDSDGPKKGVTYDKDFQKFLASCFDSLESEQKGDEEQTQKQEQNPQEVVFLTSLELRFLTSPTANTAAAENEPDNNSSTPSVDLLSVETRLLLKLMQDTESNASLPLTDAANTQSFPVFLFSGLKNLLLESQEDVTEHKEKGDQASGTDENGGDFYLLPVVQNGTDGPRKDTSSLLLVPTSPDSQHSIVSQPSSSGKAVPTSAEDSLYSLPRN